MPVPSLHAGRRAWRAAFKSPGGTLGALACALFAEAFCLGMVIPSLPSLLGTGIGHGDGPGRGAIPSVTAGALVFAVYAAMQFVSAPLLGTLSDRFGRKLLIEVSLVAAAVSYGVLALAGSALPILAARALAGLAGSVWLPANSAVSDLVAPPARAGAFGRLASTSALGYIVGPVAGGALATSGEAVPALAAAALSGIAALACSLVLAEPKARAAQDPAGAGKPLRAASELARRVAPELAALVLVQLVYRSQVFVWPYYGTIVFGWSSAAVGWVMGAYALTMATTQALATGRLVAAFGPRRVCITGLLAGTAAYACVALASSALAVCLAVAMGAAAALVSPSFQALATARVAKDRQGQFQGLVTAAVALAAMAGPPIMTQVLPGGAAASGVRAAPFLLAALLLACAAALIGRIGDATRAQE